MCLEYQIGKPTVQLIVQISYKFINYCETYLSVLEIILSLFTHGTQVGLHEHYANINEKSFNIVDQITIIKSCKLCLQNFQPKMMGFNATSTPDQNVLRVKDIFWKQFPSVMAAIHEVFYIFGTDLYNNRIIGIQGMLWVRDFSPT